MSPLVSVIIPNYNHAKYLRQRIDTVLNQTYTNFEVIILDDCSTDNSKEIIEKYRTDKRISKIIFNEFNSGGTFHQWKKGIGLAKGEWIWIAESDDYSDHNFLNKLISGINKDNQIGIAFSDSVFVDETNKAIVNPLQHGLPKGNDLIYSGSDFICEFMFRVNNIPNASAVVFKKYLFDSAKIRTDFRLCGDWVFWIDLLQNTSILFLGSQKLNFFRFHEYTVRNKTRELHFLKEYSKVAKNLLKLKNISEETKTRILDTLEYRNKSVLKNEQLTLIEKTIVLVEIFKLKLSRFL